MDEPATVLRAPRSEVDRVVAETFLAECTDKLVADLSGGQHAGPP